MKTVIYKNRYGDEIEFKRESDFLFSMNGGQYYRFALFGGENNQNIYSMADPSGGPYVSSGLDMGRFDREWDGLIVDYITIENDSVLLHMIKGRAFKGVTNNIEEIRWYPDGSEDGSFESFEDIRVMIEKHGRQQ